MHSFTACSLAFIITSLVWILPEMWLIFRDRKVEPVGGKTNGRILYYILIGGFLASLIVSSYGPANIPLVPDAKFLAGSLIIWTGMAVRWWAIRSLGKYFRIVVNIQSDHKLIKNGPYKYIRHPAYAGSLLICIGFGFGLGNWIGLALMLVLPLISFLLRAIVEEQVMISSFGKDYLSYMRRTTMFIPFIQ
jgi:protein-S-isoprenylcysteine O-methyltransferase Ste14